MYTIYSEKETYGLINAQENSTKLILNNTALVSQGKFEIRARYPEKIRYNI